jgi:hypothetical protein
MPLDWASISANYRGLRVRFLRHREQLVGLRVYLYKGRGLFCKTRTTKRYATISAVGCNIEGHD